jgi:signal transduction histidine kinase
MRERVEALQGRFKLTTRVGEGVCIAIAIPSLVVPS